jgi:hypothetical protein
MFEWLLWLGDPDPREPAPAGRIDAPTLARLLTEGERHRVLPAMTRNLRSLAAERGAGELIARPPGLHAADPLAVGLAQADLRVAYLVGTAELLRAVQDQILAALAAAGVQALVFKGTSFADRLYPDPALRPFDDIDLLVPPEALEPARTVLAGAGLTAVPQRSGKYAGRYAEEKWAHPLLGSSPVELHWNLVNSPKMRRFLSVDYRTLAATGPTPGEIGAAGLLYVAAIHAATGHGFDRLQQVFDMLQAVRGVAGPLDERALTRLAAATGGELALASALAIVANLTRDPAMARLARLTSSGPRTIGLARIFGKLPVLTAQGTGRWRHAWRRQLYRELLVRWS